MSNGHVSRAGDTPKIPSGLKCSKYGQDIEVTPFQVGDKVALKMRRSNKKRFHGELSVRDITIG